MHRTPVRPNLYALLTLTATLALPLALAGSHPAHASAPVPATATATPIGSPPPTPFGSATATSAVGVGTAPVGAGTPMTATARAAGTPTVTPIAKATHTATPHPTPRPTPDPHPGYGSVPWQPGEYSVWTVSGRDIAQGKAYQLYTHAGHQWIDSSAYTIVQQPQFAMSSTMTSTSRTAFDMNTYRLRRYDDVGLRQPNNPDDILDPSLSSVLHATLFGPHLDFTSYQSYGHAGCTVAKGRSAPVNATAYGMMADLLRAITPRAAGVTRYTVVDPYGPRPTATASYTVLGHETLSTIFGKVDTVHVRFAEGAQPPLDMWYAASPANPAHVVVKWGIHGQFGAVLTHYEKSSARVALPVAPPRIALPAKSLACA